MRTRTSAAVVTLALLLLGAMGSSAFDRPHVFGCGMIWAEWVDLPWSYDGQSMDRIVEMGGTATRATFDWVSLEPQQGVWYWDYADHQVEEAQARGLVQYAYVGNTPGWALPPGWPPSLGYRHPPDESKAAAFQNYCRTLATRYRGKIKYYFFWNEPNGCSWVNDGCSNADGYPLYTHWLKRAYTALKEGDPDCIVSAGVLDYHEGVSQGYRYIEGMYAEGAKGYFDAISIHPYASSGLHWRALEDTHRVLVNNGEGHKPIIIGEWGWPNSGGTDAANKVTYVLSELVQPKYDYVILGNYLCITDLPESTAYGLCDRNLNRRPAWYAFRDFPKVIATSTPTPTGPTPTPTNTPTATFTRTPTISPTASNTPVPQPLFNGDFEAGFEPAPPEFQDDPAYPRVKALSWNLWGTNWWKDSGVGGTTYHSPVGCQSVGTNWESLNNAVYQRVAVVPGARYRLSAWTRLEVDRPGSNRLWRAVGLDPTGGTNPTAPSVVYSAQNWTENAWQEMSVEAQAQGNAMTVFVRCKTESPEGWQWFHVDDVFLAALDLPVTDTPAPGTATPTLVPTDTPPLADLDGDGIADELEGWPPVAGQTHLLLADSDGDGLGDGVEDANRSGARDAGETDARNRDSDGDGLWDGIEVLITGTDPLDGDDPASYTDADADGLPASHDYVDNVADMDDDRYSDGYEAVMLGAGAEADYGLRPPLGDLNLDGAVSNLDALSAQSLFLRKLAPGDPVFQGAGFRNADTNRDGFISNLDSLLMQSYFLETVALLPQ